MAVGLLNLHLKVRHGVFAGLTVLLGRNGVVVLGDVGEPDVMGYLFRLFSLAGFCLVLFGVYADVHLGLVGGSEDPEGQLGHILVAGGQGEVGLEELYAAVLDAEDDLVAQSAAGSTEDEPDVALPRLLVRQFLDLDAGSAVLACYAGLDDGDVVALANLNLGGQVGTVYLLAFGGNLLDAGSYKLGLVAHH